MTHGAPPQKPFGSATAGPPSAPKTPPVPLGIRYWTHVGCCGVAVVQVESVVVVLVGTIAADALTDGLAVALASGLTPSWTSLRPTEFCACTAIV